MNINEPEELKRIDSPALQELYKDVDALKSEDITTAKKNTKAGLTRMRVLLSSVSKLCKEVRKELLEMRDGKTK